MTVYDDIILSHGPVLYLPLDDASGTTAVALAGSNGTYVGSPTLGVAGPTPVGSEGVNVNADNERVTTGLTTQWSSFSCEIWFKWAGTSLGHDFYSLVDKRSYYATSAADFPFGLYVSPSGIVTAVFSVGNDFSVDLTLSGGSSVNDGLWHHAAVTYVASSTSYLYLDGVEVSSGTVGALSSGSRGWTFGRVAHENAGGVGLTNFDGDLAAVALYNYALSAAQILNHYRAAPPAFKTIAASRASKLGAVLHLPLDDVGGTVARATVGSSGTYSGSPTLQVTGPSTYLPKGAEFSGTGQYGQLGANVFDGRSALCVEAWVRMDSFTGGPSVIGAYNGGSHNRAQFQIRTSGRLQCVLGNGSATADTADDGTVLSTGVWHHICWTWDGSTILRYVDGAVTGSSISLSGTSSSTRTPPYFAALNSTGTATQLLDGKVAALTIHTKQLTPAQVYANYRLGLDLGVGTSLSPVGY